MLLDFETEKISVSVSSLRLKHFQSQSCHCDSFFLVSLSIIQIWSPLSQVCVCVVTSNWYLRGGGFGFWGPDENSRFDFATKKIAHTKFELELLCVQLSLILFI